ncbi:hypothetical protein HPB51_015792 [Rhipicephalus microplus]|uniref:Uncharacterized protein n=1 Tax=Rhipicephalus microplus TaxID=6941 RepID=A0A9J6EIA2_RHIMP|nr:hypothetical protein HPB51_015792 [Rhipicephalus microplus]
MKTNPSSLDTNLRSFSRPIALKTEVEWQVCLRQLRSCLSRKLPERRNRVHVMKQVNLPDKILDALSLGPKFAVETKRIPEELMTFVRQVSKYATQEAVLRLITEGVDVVARSKVASPKLSVKRVADYLTDNSLCVLPADKEGGFCVLSMGVFVKKPAVSLPKSSSGAMTCH